MGWFSFTQEIAVDLGTANTIIMHNDKIVVDQPSIIARDAKTEKLIAVGERAREMQGKENPNIQTITPNGGMHSFRKHRSRDSCRTRLIRPCRRT